MNSVFYMKLAFTNIKKNAKTYVPYLLSCIGTITMFYMMSSLTESESISELPIAGSLKAFLSMGVGIIGFFAVLFLFYTNSFLVKRRKKEFGLFNILGMEKRHISKVLFFETVYTTVASLVLGIGIGIIFGKAMYLFLLRILNFDVEMGFSIPLQSIETTVSLFLIIFLLSYLNTLRQIHLTKPIDLLKGGNQGEKEPKAKWITALIGLACLLCGYYMALTVENPVAVVLELFVAIILVMIGTYCLFMAGSIVVLKILRKNKKYYYKAKHFTAVSGMIYRMKQNAAGLANICILSTGVLLSVSTTFSLYVGLEDMLFSRYPREISVSGNSTAQGGNSLEEIRTVVSKTIEEENLEEKNELAYYYATVSMLETENGLDKIDETTGLNDGIVNMAIVSILPLEDYNQITGEQETLESDEVLFYTKKGTEFENTIQVFDQTFRIKKTIDELELDGELEAMMSKVYVIIVPNHEMAVQIMNRSGQAAENLSWYCGFDLETDEQTQIEVKEKLFEDLAQAGLTGSVQGREEERASFYALYGSLFFLGIFLGVLFLMATVLIIYYKQISEGYEDRERFVIMQKVGMSQKEVKKSIHSQILMVFFLPLVTAVIHITVAFPILQKLLALLGLYHAGLFRNMLIFTVLIFVLLYAWIYSMTARTYYKIVSQKQD